ncbi:MAG TPA: TonB-dependent receptor [Pyrinomonadaceae bacterium]|nr:TonB-dependent receptor [Pyrinomonadaceae bacterium]
MGQALGFHKFPNVKVYRSFTPYLLICALTLTLLPNSLLAQEISNGSIKGKVQDVNGAVISGARISVVNNQQNTLATVQSDAEGSFRFAEIPQGTHILVALRVDFELKRLPVEVKSGSETEISIVLNPAPLLDEVTVTAETGSAVEKDRVPQEVNIIPDTAIQQRATAVLAQVAAEEVGVTMQRTSPTIGAVLVRGLTEVGVYVDGVRYTNSTQRGGINTFFNLNEPTSLRSVEVLRGPSSAQYGSDSLAGTVQLVSRQPAFGFAEPETHGEMSTFFNSADLSFGSNALITYGTKRFGSLINVVARRVNTLRPGRGVDSHSAITRFLGLPSNVTGENRLSDTAFTQYGGTLHLIFTPTDDQQLSFRYQRSQQDGGKRYDQLLGGDGNLIADLRNLMLDFGYLRYFKQDVGFFDNLSATLSYNIQREERVNQGGQGNPLAAITFDKERTGSFGFNFYFDKRFSSRNSFLVGGDIYRDRVRAPSFSSDPISGLTTLVRPRVPNGARYILAGLYVQDAHEVIPNRLRLSGALRYNVGSYLSKAVNSPVVNGQPLFPDDSLRVADVSGRIGAVVTPTPGLNVVINYSRGFRAPNITNLGSLGLVGVGYQVSSADVAGFGATVGTTADENAISSGLEVKPLRSERSNNYELGLRYRKGGFDTELIGFVINYADSIVRQTLILPPDAMGLSLGSQIIESQNSNGAVFVPLSTSPVLVQANFAAARLKGIEYEFDWRLADSWTFGGNYSYVRAEDPKTGEPPNLGGGGTPPQMAFVSVRYQPPNKHYWVEAYSTVAGRQRRLSTLDLSDRRTGATRSRVSIQNFFRRGACVRGLTTPGDTGQCGSAGGRLIATGETLEEVQHRLLGDLDSAALFRAIPGYGLINVRGGFRIGDTNDVSIGFENIGDKSYRAPGWGVDGLGRSVSVRYRYTF